MEDMERLRRFFSGKNILLTGHTGFKGAWLSKLLLQLGAKVSGISLPAQSGDLYEELRLDSDLESFYIDITNESEYLQIVKKINPEIVINLAAKSLVKESYSNPLITWKTNLMGTANLLEALRYCSSCKVAILITTDKVYKESADIYSYREGDILGGHDPYSASKAASELLIDSYRSSFFQKNIHPNIAAVRAGNVIGGGDWSINRLFPDLVRAWAAGKPAQIRNPYHSRPWQHVLDVLNGYLLLAVKLWGNNHFPRAFNIGPMYSSDMNVLQISNLAQKFWPDAKITIISDESKQHENSQLFLDSSLAMRTLGYLPRWDLETSVARTIRWYQEYSNFASAVDLCNRDICNYYNNQS